MVLRDNINDKTMLDDLNIFLFAYCIQQSSFHFPTGNIFMMQYSEFRMSAFTATFIITIFFFIKPCAPFNNFIYSFRAFFHNNLHHFFIT